VKTFVISDIHGCYDELMALYKKLPIDPQKDRVVFLGDYIDHGPKTKQVIEQLITWKKKYPHWVMLYGNHEDLMLDALLYGMIIYHSFDLWYSQGGKETYLSYIPKNLTAYEKSLIQVKDAIPQKHLFWLAALPRFFEDDMYIYVHAGLEPKRSPEETDPQQLIWIRDEFINSKYDWGKKVIFGHTVDDRGKYYNENNPWGKEQKFMPIVMTNKIGIDTAVCPPSKKKLTAIELPTEKFYFQKAL
jgi:serine/threonine protein phosphatase 1